MKSARTSSASRVDASLESRLAFGYMPAALCAPAGGGAGGQARKAAVRAVSAEPRQPAALSGASWNRHCPGKASSQARWLARIASRPKMVASRRSACSAWVIKRLAAVRGGLAQIAVSAAVAASKQSVLASAASAVCGEMLESGT